jgi:hypothetical protein
MSILLLNPLAIGLAVGCALLADVAPLRADNKHDYPETGTVISTIADHGEVYKIETADKIYQMVCGNGGALQSIPPQCDISGKLISVKDTVHFRIEDGDDEDLAYIPASGNREEKLRILSTELKVLPPQPATSNLSAGENCAVLGRGMDLAPWRYGLGGASTVIPTGPFTAVPVTGGPPVQVIAGGPYTEGVITGVSTTSGRPVTAIPVESVPGIPIDGSTDMLFSSPVWIPFLAFKPPGTSTNLLARLKNVGSRIGRLCLVIS